MVQQNDKVSQLTLINAFGFGFDLQMILTSHSKGALQQITLHNKKNIL